MKLAIVGSRSRNSKFDEEIVQGVILVAYAYWPDLAIVSGGYESGVAGFARKMCSNAQIPFIEYVFRPQIGLSYDAAVERYYHERKYKIANDCDALVALVADDGMNGIQDVITYAKRLNKPMFLVSSTFPKEEGKRLVGFLKTMGWQSHFA